MNNKIDSRIDFCLESCYANCFVCGKPFEEPPNVDRYGQLSRALWFNVIVDKYGNKEETDERICNECWVSDLTQFGVDQEPRLIKKITILD